MDFSMMDGKGGRKWALVAHLDSEKRNRLAHLVWECGYTPMPTSDPLAVCRALFYGKIEMFVSGMQLNHFTAAGLLTLLRRCRIPAPKTIIVSDDWEGQTDASVARLHADACLQDPPSADSLFAAIQRMEKKPVAEKTRS